NFPIDPFGYLRAKVQSLILWENRRNSALVLTGTLSFLILTQYYSLLQIAAGIFFFITGLNWVFVIIYKQGQKYIYGKAPEELTNPHRERLRYNGSYIPRDRIVHLAQLSVDVFEVFAQHITKLVLIENSWRSAVALVISFTVWTLAKYISTKYLIGLFLLSAFTGPRLYLQHQAVIDAHLQQLLQQTQSSTEKYGGLACAKAKELSHQATEFIK
ncbi:Reticulon-domain-containing protein, partial [Mycotypha africana]|uniref:Reticulon-domain-containing protein n=1 Tax=Mycotypha africana TaxID=64632 RepID=UPI002300EB6D